MAELRDKLRTGETSLLIMFRQGRRNKKKHIIKRKKGTSA
jgi:hypothetical protein